MIRLDCENIDFSLCNFELHINNGQKTLYNVDLQSDIELDDKKELIWSMLVRAADGGDISDSLIAQCISRTYKLPENTIMDTVIYVKKVINELLQKQFLIIR